MTRAVHTPKFLALSAYAEERLSPAARAHVERHLAECATCREALGAIRVYRGLANEAATAPVPEPDWDRMELALRAEARTQARSLRTRLPRRIGIGVALAAAAALVVFVARREPQPEVAAAPSPRPIATHDAEDVRAAGTAGFTVLGGDVRITREGGAEELATFDSRLTEGMRIGVSQGALAHVRIAAGTGFVLDAATTITLRELRAGQVVLDLERGRVTSRVHKLGAGDRYEVLGDDVRVSVRGTHFAVARDDHGVIVSCEEGLVVVSAGEEELARVGAEQVWTSSHGRTSARRLAGEAFVDRLALPRGLDRAADAWPLLALPSGVPGIAAWEVDAVRFDVPGALAMRVPAGDVRLAAFDARGRAFRTAVSVPIEGLTVNERAIVIPTVPEERTEGTLDTTAAAPIIRAGVARLQRCQEATARRGPDVTGHFTLRVTVGRRGEVSQAELLAGGRVLPPDFVSCVTSEARGWRFPAPTGGTVTFDQPLRFGVRRQ